MLLFSLLFSLILTLGNEHHTDINTYNRLKTIRMTAVLKFRPFTMLICVMLVAKI